MAQFAAWLAAHGIPWPNNLVAMTSVTSRKSLSRVQALLEVPAAARMLSIEPLWEKVELPLAGINGVIVGGESGAWARDIHRQCRAAGVSFSLKQLGAKPMQDGQPLALRDQHGGDWGEWPPDLRIRELPAALRDGRAS